MAAVIGLGSAAVIYIVGTSGSRSQAASSGLGGRGSRGYGELDPYVGGSSRGSPSAVDMHRFYIARKDH